MTGSSLCPLMAQLLCGESVCPVTRLSLVAQVVKNPPAMREMWVRSLGREDSLEAGMAIHSRTLAGRTPRTEAPGRLQSMGFKESDTTEQLKHCTAHPLAPMG